MPTQDELVVGTIAKHFEDNVRAYFVAPPAPPILTVYDNDPTEPPSAEEEWLRVSVLWGEALQTEFGAPKAFREVGILTVQVFTPLNQGDARAYEIASKVIEFFRSRDLAHGVTFRTPSKQYVGRSGQYWQLNINCPFFVRAVVAA